jgi:hypothetical protein
VVDVERRRIAVWRPRLECRLLAADLVGEEAVLDSLRALREEIAEISAQLDTAEAVAATIASRDKYLLLNHRLARAIVQAHTYWLDEVERELGQRPRRGASASASGS